MKLVRILLFPFAIIYDLITSLRNLFFNIGIFKQKTFKIPVVVVGNLSVGGTGKTPQIEYLIRLLQGKVNLAILSRGYKRKTKGFVLLNTNHTAEDVGDEPLQYFKKYTDISVAVDANRVNGIETLLKEKSPEIVLLDDAFQHRKVKASFYILLTKYNDLFINDFLLPTGNLRENRNGANRSDIILVTKCPKNLDKNTQEKITNQLKKYHKKIFFTTIAYADKLAGEHQIAIDDLKGYTILLITGIANPAPLLDFLSSKQLTFKHLSFPDHHHFSSKEIEVIQKKFDEITSNKKIIVTTEKDYTRLYGKLANLSYLEIETAFLDNQDTVFNKIITSHIQQNRY